MTPAAPDDARVEAMREALQTTWDDWAQDTGCFPECFTISRGPKLWANFAISNFTRHLAQNYMDHATSRISKLEEQVRILSDGLAIVTAEAKAWRTGLNTRTGMKNMNQAKVGCAFTFGGLEQYERLVASVRANLATADPKPRS